VVVGNPVEPAVSCHVVRSHWAVVVARQLHPVSLPCGGPGEGGENDHGQVQLSDDGASPVQVATADVVHVVADHATATCTVMDS
jgi:hypothetical protein